MSRPRKCRRISFSPEVTYFKPSGRSLRMLDEIELSFEELEAIRLKDMERLEQEQGAEEMNISRPTFQRILASARQKIAEALLKGKAIRIGGEIFDVPLQHFKCINEHEWTASCNILGSEQSIVCPVCNTGEVLLVSQAVPALSQPGSRYYRRDQGWERQDRTKKAPVTLQTGKND